MELNSEDVLALHGRSEAVVVLGLRENDCFAAHHKMVGVNEVELRAVWDVFEKSALPFLHDFVPSHVRVLEADRVTDLEADNLSVEPAKSVGIAFFTPVSHELHSEADSKYGGATCASVID